MSQSSILLSLSIWVPILFGVLVLWSGKTGSRNLTLGLSLVGSIFGFLVTIPLYTQFLTASAGYQFEEFVSWIPAFNINYHLGIDGISLWFVLLNSLMTIFVVIAGWVVVEKRVAQYMAAFLIMSGLINGTFASMDAILFYVFFEAMLIPMYLIIGVWGGTRRVYASIKFFLYTLLGSLLMLIAFIYLYFEVGASFEIVRFQQVMLPMSVQLFLFVAFFLSFAVKVPMWPVHTWLPDAHVEAPTGGSVILLSLIHI